MMRSCDGLLEVLGSTAGLLDEGDQVRFADLIEKRNEVLDHLDTLLVKYMQREAVKEYILPNRLFQRLRHPIFIGNKIYKNLHYEVESLELLYKAMETLHTSAVSRSNSNIASPAPHMTNVTYVNATASTVPPINEPAAEVNPSDTEVPSQQIQAPQTSDESLSSHCDTSVGLTTFTGVPLVKERIAESRSQNLRKFSYGERFSNYAAQASNSGAVDTDSDAVASAIRQLAQALKPSDASAGLTPTVQTAPGIGVPTAAASISNALMSILTNITAREHAKHTVEFDS